VTHARGAGVVISCLAAIASCRRPAPPAPGTAPATRAAAPEAHAPAPADWRALDLPSPLARLLASGRWDKTPVGFRIVTLSFLADACAGIARRTPETRSAAASCVSRAFELAERTRPDDLRVASAEHGLWLSHFALVLGAADALGPCPDAKAHAAIASALARRALREPTSHVPSYPRTAFRWPADQTATLASLARFDRAHGGHLAGEPTRRWRAHVLARAMDRDLHLPWSEVTGKAKGARDPRGCALSWQTRYLREVDPALAADWWRRYKDAYLVDRLLVIGFREWPAGRERRADIDSGPIVNGVGAAATALAIAAARAMDDELLATRLEATAALVETWAGTDPTFARHASTALAASIRFLGRTP
jgi:hypothetical protein